MGLIQNDVDRLGHYNVRASADWPVRILYGLVTIYQGLFGLLVPSNLFYEMRIWNPWTVAIIAGLILTGGLLVIDGLIGMIRYCTRVNCMPVSTVMRLFHRWRHLLFLPPVFCYYLAMQVILVLQVQVVAHDMVPVGSPILYAYYTTLALCGMAFCLRDAIISNQCNRRSA